MKIVRCRHCGNIAYVLKDSGVSMMCCGEAMKELDPLTRDGALEKHVPVYTVNGNEVHVEVGSVIHPMEEKHYIEWIIVETNLNTHIRKLTPSDEPKADIALVTGEKVVSVYEYCNLHGFWKSE